MTTKSQKKNKNISSDALIQHDKLRNEKRILSDNTPFDVVEAYRALRTNIMFSLNKEKGCKKISITSATSGEGKTTTCINVAKTFAQIGARVLIVDADLRAPRVHKYLDISAEKGLSNVLAGFEKPDDCVIKTSTDNLDCLVAGPIPPNPAELISSEAMLEFIKYVDGIYDYVFFDTPPINIVTEAVLLSEYVTGVLLVVRQKYTMYKMVERAMTALNFADAKILGFILNDVGDDKYMYGTYYRGGRRRGRYYKYSHYSRYSHYSSHKYRAAKYIASKVKAKDFAQNVEAGVSESKKKNNSEKSHKKKDKNKQ